MPANKKSSLLHNSSPLGTLASSSRSTLASSSRSTLASSSRGLTAGSSWNYAPKSGFTLLEVLLALFVFTIVAMIVTTTLHNVFSNQSRLQERDQAFTEIQNALLLLSRDIEQTINRPILNTHGEQEFALVGNTQQITFTHAGFANPFNQFQRSTLQRTRYRLDNGNLIRDIWPVLDQSPHTQPTSRVLLHDVSNLRFTYLNTNGQFESRWPRPDQFNITAPPRAVQMTMTINHWGKIKQFYLIPGQALEQKPSENK